VIAFVTLITLKTLMTLLAIVTDPLETDEGVHVGSVCTGLVCVQGACAVLCRERVCRGLVCVEFCR
jgi:hypothetical protein